MNAPTDPFSLLEVEPIVSGPGLYPNLSNHAYHSGPGISKSGLDMIAHSPSMYPWSKAAPVHKEKLQALDFGTALHCWLLEPEEFDKQFIKLPEIDRRTNAGKAEYGEFCIAAEESDQILITADDFEKLKVMRDSVMAHPVARWIFEQPAVNESSIYWIDQQTEELCRIRPDRMLTEQPIIVDVKKVEGLDRFERHVAEFRYHVQDAMYSEGYFQHFGNHPQFWFLAVSSTVSAGRYAVDVVEIPQDWKQDGHSTFRRDLNTYHHCRQNDDWLHIRTLERPRWA